MRTRGVRTVPGFWKNAVSGPVLDVVVELLVVELPAGERLPAPALRQLHAGRQAVEGVHRPRVVDVVGGDERRVERAGPRGAEELLGEARRVGLPVEDAVDPEVLRSDDGAQVLPPRVLGVGRAGSSGSGPRGRTRTSFRPGRASRGPSTRSTSRPRSSRFASHLSRRLLVEGGVREEPQADDAAGERRSRSRPACSFRAPRSSTPGVLRLVVEGIGRAVGATLVEPEAVALRVGARRLLEAGLVDEAEVGPPVVAARPFRATGATRASSGSRACRGSSC